MKKREISPKQAEKARKAALRAEKHTLKHGPKAKTTFRRNVLPVVVGLTVMVAVLAGMNAQWLYAQLKYRASQPAATAQTVAVTSSTSSAASVDANKDPNPELGPRIEIPSINVKAPVQLNQGTAEWQIQLGLRKGVVHYDGSANPGQTGNVVIFGHSSGALWAPGDYKFIFTLLDKVAVGDKIYVYDKGERYTYEMRSSQVVSPSDTGVLKAGDDHELTLITCTPVGTSKNRLVVHAEQIAPAPSSSSGSGSSSAGAAGSTLTALPGSAH